MHKSKKVSLKYLFILNKIQQRKMSREVLKKFENIEQKEGDGVKVRRSLGTSQVIKSKLLLN